jgi:diguanylate cyclase (GGDEF)-like protein
MRDGGWVSSHEDVTERRRAEQERNRNLELIGRLARYDSLTELSNRLLFCEQLDYVLANVKPSERFAVLYIDIDHFKRVNDTLGHPVGDALLKSVAARLRASVRAGDVVSRLGGDEFAVLQRSIAGASDAAALAERIRETVGAPHMLEGHEVVSDASIGISLSPDDSIDRDQLLRNADLALYAAKASGRGTYRFYKPEMSARIKARQELEHDLRHALSRHHFTLHYQPIVELRGNRVTGCEALLRWHDPERGTVEPSEFIPVAEESGLIIRLGEWVLRQACRDAAAWPEDKKIAVNVSAAQLTGGQLTPIVVGALAESGLAPSRLELEITETVLMQSSDEALSTLRQLRDLGVRIALDDFGIGYSSLGYLRSFPFDTIKIDRSFVAGLSEEGDCVAIIKAVTNMAQNLEMTTTAEGVETEQQRQMLRELGCIAMQGYLFSPPRPVEEIVHLFLMQVDRTANAA